MDSLEDVQLNKGVYSAVLSPPCTIILLGMGKDPSGMRVFEREEKKRDRVTFLGFVTGCGGEKLPVIG